MSQLGRKARPGRRAPVRGAAGPGTFEGVAGFRNGRGRDDGAPHARPQHPPYGQQAPQGPSYGGPAAPRPPYPQQPYGGGAPGGSPWPQGHAGGHAGGHGEPEYFGDGGYPPGPQGPHGGHRPQGPHAGYGAPAPQPPYDPYAANNPGHTQAFALGEDPYSQGETYRAGAAAPPPGPSGPPLRWKELLKGIVVAPNQTFLRMRDYTMWVPALIVTFLYGLLAVFGFDGAREEAINATLSNAVPIVLITAVALVLSAFVLGVVTHTLARQLGGDGAWQPTVGLSMLIMSITDAPRLVVAMFAGGDAPFVQLLGWATWIAGGALLTLMVGRSHDLPWPRALGASAIQLVALLSIVKLGTF
ncbi:Yip1 family protein [Streptomyces sp. SHP 1-2]|uniref:Yip1 family protein n=1 Tax=Streptomyces sp. SHP 1-2 TaxID=2769489 RepID=UPI002238028D|nr:Yip1 family protein [Streptomyces sp. SHP 1-2]MCW5254767.1 YIP1 family protein [Streptomyces sp. SHP 1-2]